MQLKDQLGESGEIDPPVAIISPEDGAGMTSGENADPMLKELLVLLRTQQLVKLQQYFSEISNGASWMKVPLMVV